METGDVQRGPGLPIFQVVMDKVVLSKRFVWCPHFKMWPNVSCPSPQRSIWMLKTSLLLDSISSPHSSIKISTISK